MVILFDYDSLLYKCVYRIVSIRTIRSWIMAGKSRVWMENEIIQSSINRLCNMGDKIFYEIEETGIEIQSVEYFITYMQTPKRLEWSDVYKANRKKNKWVSRIRQYLIESNFAHSHPSLEADDLIADRAKELNDGEYIILSIDKDLKTIKGIHFDYYKKPTKPGELPSEMRGLSVITEQDAEFNFWMQMLTGDLGDNISGLPGVGPKTALKMISGVECYRTTVKALYKKYFPYTWSNKFYVAYNLLKLGSTENELI